MPRQPKPWYRAGKDCWYARVGGKRVSLGVRGKANKPDALKVWHRVMSGAPGPTVPERPKARATVREVIVGFLADVETRVTAKSSRWYKAMLEPFSESHGGAPAEGLTPARAQEYAATRNWGPGTRHGYFGVLRMAFCWAERVGLIPTNPLKALKRPPMPSRGTGSVISPDVHKRLLTHAHDHFKPFLTLLRETGARPSELSRLTARDVDFGNGLAMLSQHKTAGKTGKPRLIFLSPKAKSALRSLARVNPNGPLLRTRLGTSWTKDAVVLAFRRISGRAGVKATAYGYRHTFATDALAAGVPDAHVAELLGHASTAMLHKHYSHLTARTKVLAAAARRVR